MRCLDKGSHTASSGNKPNALNVNPRGLNKRTTSEGLKEAFSKFGQVIEARVITDRISGYSRGFGFVKYATVQEAGEAIKGMDGKFLDSWVIFAETPHNHHNKEHQLMIEVAIHGR
ncbi:ELAV-like protein 4 [Zea mays]|uniref:ELAV-like protein 4 n=1 Tax=Zea mays TaxID=4577 RepID=A0A1D6EXU0_MAIZE|nr:ELAV-like protein 4 [Zea mays]